MEVSELGAFSFVI